VIGRAKSRNGMPTARVGAKFGDGSWLTTLTTLSLRNGGCGPSSSAALNGGRIARYGIGAERTVRPCRAASRSRICHNVQPWELLECHALASPFVPVHH
jgi:hypothetical protein